MSGRKPVVYPTDMVYIYDGTLAGFFTCVYESVYQKQMPLAIIFGEEEQFSLFRRREIETDQIKAKKVYDSIPVKISKRALDLIETVFFSCLEDKELIMLEFLLRGYGIGASITKMMGDPLVSTLLKADRHLKGEAHLLLGFIRFSDADGFLTSTISPKNFILPFIANHFVSRYREENFVIYDKIHQAVLVYQDGKTEILKVDHIVFPEVTEEEGNYQALWKQFYKTISIESRKNPRCRMTHMPKRYWENMLEVQELL